MGMKILWQRYLFLLQSFSPGFYIGSLLVIAGFGLINFDSFKPSDPVFSNLPSEPLDSEDTRLSFGGPPTPEEEDAHMQLRS